MSNFTYQWDPADYARNSQGQERWARELMALAAFKPGENVMDLGCGDGRMTAEIARMVSSGPVLGVDRSAEMIQFARQQFPSSRFPNLSFRQIDARNLSFDGEFEVVFSSAVLHWVRDHQPVLAGIARSLKPGGRCILQMGGKGNTQDVINAFNQCLNLPRWQKALVGFEFPYNFYDAREYREWVEKVGLVPDSVELLEKDMVHPDREAFRGWLRTAWQPFHASIPDHERSEFLEVVTDCFIKANPSDKNGIHAKAVRLQAVAHKPASKTERPEIYLRP